MVGLPWFHEHGGERLGNSFSCKGLRMDYFVETQKYQESPEKLG
jgi:hypothetical protein